MKIILDGKEIAKIKELLSQQTSIVSGINMKLCTLLEGTLDSQVKGKDVISYSFAEETADWIVGQNDGVLQMNLRVGLILNGSRIESDQAAKKKG